LKRTLPVPPWLAVVVLTVTGAGGLLACTEKSGTDPTETTPAAPAQPQTSNGDAVATPQNPARCEELGALSATSLTGTFDVSGSPEVETTSFTLPNRPAATKVKVVAIGAPTELVGKGAVLGAGVNASYGTCSHCLVVAIGCTATSCAGATLFFPRKGTATFTALAESTGQPFSGTFTDVELEQVTVDAATFASSPVVNGACMHVTSLTFGSTLSNAQPDVDGGGGGGTSASSSGGTDSGTDPPADGGGTSGKSSTSSGGNAGTTTLMDL
jgi:hypothetical protein